MIADPAARLAAELRGRGCREVLALLDEARRRGRAMPIAMIEVDAAGRLELVLQKRLSPENQSLQRAGE